MQASFCRQRFESHGLVLPPPLCPACGPAACWSTGCGSAQAHMWVTCVPSGCGPAEIDMTCAQGRCSSAWACRFTLARSCKTYPGPIYESHTPTMPRKPWRHRRGASTRMGGPQPAGPRMAAACAREHAESNAPAKMSASQLYATIRGKWSRRRGVYKCPCTHTHTHTHACALTHAHTHTHTCARAA